MCGIAGIFKHDTAVDRELVSAMISTLGHRGPDGQGIFVDANVGLGHARLSILDLQSGHQPMSIEDGGYWITFNGEIFNYLELRAELEQRGHKFATRSDTEVILRLYLEKGENCVHEMNGQWAFAIWDKQERKLFLSRDRFGVRPLFYTRVNGDFLFASEIKALFTCPEVTRELDAHGLDQIFTFWVTLPPRTAFAGIDQLPPGHSLTVRDTELCIKQYWRLDFCATDPIATDCADPKGEQLLALMEDAARIRLRSDVPVGAYLSGGIDSTFTTSLIAGIAEDRLRTFSVAFADSDFDETFYQKEASDFLGTRHSTVQCSSDDIARIFPDVIWHTEQPILRTAPAPLYLLSKLVRQSGFKVVLTGEGSDEILGGYDIYKEAKIRRFWARQPGSSWRPLLLRRLYPYLEKIQQQPEAYLRSFFRIRGEDLSSPFFSHLPRWELTAKLKLFFSEQIKSQIADYDGFGEVAGTLPSCYGQWPQFCQAQYLESTQLLPGYILSSQGDRMAMAHSVEGRYPFLDHRVSEFASKLHPSFKMRALDEKYLLKKAARSRIPTNILRRTKQPYRAPDGKSFFGDRSPDYVQELLSPEAVKRSGIFKSGPVGNLVSKFKQHRDITTKDDMAVIGILSTQLLAHRFLHAC